MNENKIQIMYISYCTPYDKVPHAGGQTLYFYLKNLSRNKRYDISLISFCNKYVNEVIK